MAQCCTPTEESVGVTHRNEVSGRWECLEQAPQTWERLAKKRHYTFLARRRAAPSFPTESLGFATCHCRAGAVPAGAVTLWPDFMPREGSRPFSTRSDGICPSMYTFCNRGRSQQHFSVIRCIGEVSLTCPPGSTCSSGAASLAKGRSAAGQWDSLHWWHRWVTLAALQSKA